MEDLLKVGVLTTTHGIRGEVKVYPTTDADRFLDLEYVLLDTGREKRKLEIENVKYFKNLVILKFRGIDNINDIEMYKKRELHPYRSGLQCNIHLLQAPALLLSGSRVLFFYKSLYH